MDDAIREMHDHERRFLTPLPPDHLYVKIFRRFMNIDDDHATEPLVIEDMRLLKDKPALASKLTHIRVLSPFDASIKCAGVRTITVSTTAISSIYSYNERRRRTNSC
eukprot:789566-Pleurochrysis_carterae.AAC.1